MGNAVVVAIFSCISIVALWHIGVAVFSFETKAEKHRRCLNRINALEHEIFPEWFPKNDPERYGIPGRKGPG